MTKVESIIVGEQDIEPTGAVQPEPVDPKEELYQQIMERLDKTGDLPIFSASVNRVQLVGNDPDSDAMTLALEVLKDANLSTKMLRLSNSTYYNRGANKIGSLSRAIVMLGFDAVKSTVLALKMIDSLQLDNNDVDMCSMLVNSYMTAGLVKEVASECGLKNVEQSYVCGLLHNIGEVILAYTMPDKYLQMKRLADEEMSWQEAQKKVIGMPLKKIGQMIVERWDFPKSVSGTMAPYNGNNKKGPLRDPVEINRSLAALSTRMMDLLYSDNPTTKQGFADITQEMSKVAGITSDVVGQCLNKSFKQSCDLAEEYGLDKNLLVPRKNNTDDEERDEIATMLSSFVKVEDDDPEEEGYFTAEDDGYESEAHEVISPEEVEELESLVEPGGDASYLLDVLHDLTTMMTNKAHLNSVFKKVLEGMHKGLGFDRAMLCLLSPDHQYYNGRMVVGYQAEKIKQFFYQYPINVMGDVFSKMIMEDDLLLVTDIHNGNWLQRLPANFEKTVAANSFLIAALRIKNKPIGMFYVDKARQDTPITQEEQRGFLQLVAQAQLALQVH